MHGVTTIAEEIVDVCQKNEKACPRIGSHLPFNCILNSLGWLPWFGTEKTPNRKCHVNLHSDVNHYWITEELYPSNGKELLPILGVCIKLKKCKNQKKKGPFRVLSWTKRGKDKGRAKGFFNSGRKLPKDKKMPSVPDDRSQHQHAPGSCRCKLRPPSGLWSAPWRRQESGLSAKQSSLRAHLPISCPSVSPSYSMSFLGTVLWPGQLLWGLVAVVNLLWWEQNTYLWPPVSHQDPAGLVHQNPYTLRHTLV